MNKTSFVQKGNPFSLNDGLQPEIGNPYGRRHIQNGNPAVLHELFLKVFNILSILVKPFQIFKTILLFKSLMIKWNPLALKGNPYQNLYN